MKLISLLLLFFLLFSSKTAFSQDESLTITTYYPSPNGVYRNLRLFPIASAPLCACDKDEGTMYYDNSGTAHMMKVCSYNGTAYYWANLTSGASNSFWSAAGTNNIRNSNAGTVGIGGAPTGADKLQVIGSVNATGDVCLSSGLCLSQIADLVNGQALAMNVHTAGECTAAGGTVVTVGGSTKICRFNVGGCTSPSGCCPAGWIWYQKWSAANGGTVCRSCWGSECKYCGGYSWSNTDPCCSFSCTANNCACGCVLGRPITQIGCY